MQNEIALSKAECQEFQDLYFKVLCLNKKLFEAQSAIISGNFEKAIKSEEEIANVFKLTDLNHRE